MRYLKEYPITREEVIEVLEKIPMQNPPGTPPDQMMTGGPNDMIRNHIIEFVKKHENMASLLKEMEW